MSDMAHAQDSIIVSGHFVNNTKYAKVLMKKFDMGSFPVGGAAIKDEKFSLALPADIEPGVYRFQYAAAQGEKYLDIIINGQESKISFSLQADDEYALPNFSALEENKRWYAYLEETRAQMERIDLLNQFINAYPNANAKVVKAAEQEWEEEKALYESNFNAFVKENADTWACEMVANRPYYFTNPKDEPRIQDYEKREHFWDSFDASNPKLINSPLYTEHILNYLRYWMNPNMNFSAEEKTEGFKRAVDVIIRNFSGNEQTHEFAYKYLTMGFKEIGEEEVLQYLDENYSDLAEQCFDDVEKSEFEQRMEGYAAMKVGNKAPDFELNVTRVNSNAKSLYKVKAAQTLAIFWSSTCPHCLEEMPKLNAWAAEHSDVQVVAVSIDNDEALHKQTIAKYPNMLHTCDFKGWDTEAAQQYYVVATPTFVRLDKDKKIIGKYSSFEQVQGID
jgi:thiol-disulfide isomerase/thioredoxin